MMKRFYLCPECFKKMTLFNIEVFTCQTGVCDGCGKQASCFIELPQVELPAERLSILE
jgi:hypothetical protein